MNQLKLLFLILLIVTACGKHTSENFGYMSNGDVSENIKATTLSGKIKTSMDTNNFEDFKSLLQQSGDINLRLPDTENATPLIYSAVKDLPLFANYLVKQGADLKLLDDNGKTAEQRALDTGGRERILLILDPSRQQQMQGELFIAVSKKKVLTISELLKAGVDPNFVDTETGETPLTKSITLKKAANVAKALVDWKDPGFGVTNTDINFPNQQGFTPLAYAIEKKNTDIIELLKALNAKETL